MPASLPRFHQGDAVRVIRNIRNDGTFPGEEVGALLVRRGSVGYVRDMGTFLQDQIICSVHFLDCNRLVGCREEELQAEADPWLPSRFEFRDKVTPHLPLALGGEIIAEPGTIGEILKVLRDFPNGIQYHVHISGRTLQVPETALDACADQDALAQ
jgi:nitrogen fixation protein NifZ